MRLRTKMILVCTVLCLAATASWADLTSYERDFEGLVQADPAALANDGWLVFGNVFGLDWTYWYGYGPYPAPNGGSAFSAVAAGEGGPDQGAQQLSVYSDYNNNLHPIAWIESNVFQERMIGAADVGTTWVLKFDAKRGNIFGLTTAKAFFKTLDPAAGYALTNFIWIDMTNVAATWEGYSLSIFIDPSLAGQVLQFGFLNTATGYQGSGVFYDNVRFIRQVHFDVKPGSCPNPVQTLSQGVLPVAVLATEAFDVHDIDVASLQLEGVAPFHSDYEDVAAPYSGALCGCTASGPDGFVDLTLKFVTQDILDAIGGMPTGDRVLTLTGNLLDGTAIEGQDCVVVMTGGGTVPGHQVFSTGDGADQEVGPDSSVSRK